MNGDCLMQKQQVMIMENKTFPSYICCEIYARRNILITIWKGFSLSVTYVKKISNRIMGKIKQKARKITYSVQ
jgi:hypothetical protein